MSGFPPESTESGVAGVSGAPTGADTEGLLSGVPEAGVLRLISDLESQLRVLKRAHEERARAEAELTQRHAAVEGRQAALAARAEEVEGDRKELDELLRGLEEREGVLKRERQELEAVHVASEEAKRAAEARAREMSDRARAAEEASEKAGSDREEATRRAGEAERRAKEATDRAGRAERAAAELGRAGAERAAEAVRLAADLATVREGVEENGAALDEARAQLAGANADLERLGGELEGARASAVAAEGLRAGLESEIAALRASAEEQVRGFEERVSGATAGRMAVEARAASLQNDVDRLEAELAERAGVLGSNGAELEAARAELESTRAELGSARASLNAAQAELEEARSRPAVVEGPAAGAEEFEAELNKRDLAIRLLKERLGSAKGERDALGVEVGSLREAVQGLRERVADGGVMGGGGAPAGFTGARRERLRRYRGLLQSRMRKLMAAKEALQKRQGECEAVLQQRARLAAAVEAIRQREQKLSVRRAKSQAAGVMFFSVGTLGLLAALSWAVTSQVVPATYAVQAVVEADGQGRALGAEELNEWQRYHEEIAKDPRLMEVAAERFVRRGMPALGTPPDVQARFGPDLDVRSTKKGSVVLELRGKGAERTERELDTFATAMISVANQARENRGTGALTTITQPAKAGREPIEDQRPVYVGVVMAIGASLAAAIALASWKMLVRSKLKYEAAQGGDGMEEWAEPGAAR